MKLTIKSLKKNQLAITFFLMFSNFCAEARVCKEISGKWSWFGDHAVGSIQYSIAMPLGRIVLVGTGIKIWGKPRGSIYRNDKPFQIKAYGIGAIHAHSEDGDPVRVCIDSRSATAISLYNDEF